MKRIVAVLICGTLAHADEFPSFRSVTIDDQADKVVYAVTLADVNGDKAQDIVAVTDRAVYWYAAPDWEKRTIIADQTERDNVCIAAHDIDQDGRVDFALGAGWTKKGTIQWLRQGDDGQSWSVHQIGVEPWLHRMRFADVLGTGTPQLVISPLNKTQGNGVRLTAFAVPANPRTDRWQATVMDARLNRMHNHWHIDLNGDSRIDTLTASAEGVHLISRDGDRWTSARLSAGQSGSATGAGEIKTGRLRDGSTFLVTVEPMHGESIVVYTNLTGREWRRSVLDDSLKRGHAIWAANLDADPEDEIVFGHSDRGTGAVAGPGVFVFDAVGGDGSKWRRYTVDDGGVATEDLVAGDVTGDGRIDIVAGGRATHNVMLYVNNASR